MLGIHWEAKHARFFPSSDSISINLGPTLPYLALHLDLSNNFLVPIHGGPRVKKKDKRRRERLQNARVS